MLDAVYRAARDRVGALAAERRDRPVEELLAEWERAAPAVESSLPQQHTGPNLAADAICHEADLHEALGLPRLDRAHWQPFLEVMGYFPGRRLRGTATLVISDDLGQQWRCGSGVSVMELRADGYELLRGVFSRRSRRQIAGWDWSLEPPGEVVDGFGAFGPRDDDQPVPTG